MPQEQMPHFPALEKLAAKGFLSVETWNNKRAMLNFKATVEVPMLGTMIESCGDTLDESHMPLGWPLSIDGAVRQFCMHKRATIQELNDTEFTPLHLLPLRCSNVETHQHHTSQHRVGNKGLEQGRPPLRLQNSYQFKVQKTNPKTSLLDLLVLIMTTCPFLLC